MTIPSGTKFGRYELRSQIGAGGMGEVYLAQDTKLDRKVALKILPVDLAANQDRMRRFVLEAKAAAALNHPNIAHIYEISEDKGTNFIAMEFVDGETLREKIREKSDLKILLKHLLQVAEGLAKAHAVGIVHRDLKPDNIMITRDGHAKILDFGLAKLLEPAGQKPDREGGLQNEPGASEIATAMMPVGHSTPGVVMGTVGYMSPEQAQAKPVDQRSDIFSFGCLLYEAATGRKPFAGDSIIDTLHRIIYEPAPAIADFNPSASPELQRVIRKCLAKEPEKRYQTIRDTGNDLEELIAEMKGLSDIERSVAPATSVTTSGATNSTDDNVGAESTVSVSRPPTSSAEYLVSGLRQHRLAAVIALLVLVAGAVGLGLYLQARNTEVAIESIAVLPFDNQNHDPETEYLSDGLTDSIINSLTQLPKLRVIARSSVFRYKGKQTDPIAIANELGVRAMLTGRIMQRGDRLTIGVELIDARDNKQLWGERYERKVADLISLQREIARDVSQKLRARLSGADEQRVTKDYTANAEAYQLYLKGRFHTLKLTPPEVQRGISYLQQAIQIDPNYTLAYVGLSDANRQLAIAGEMTPTEFFPKARAAAQKAIELDDALAEAHAALGLINFWYDWDWNEAEKQCKRALELNPNNAETHQAYAHLFTTTGRHAEGLAEIKRARELDPLNLRTNALEGQALIYAGQTDEALARLQKTFELEPNFWLPHVFAASAYIEKGMFPEAVAEARKASELSDGNSQSIAFLGYALAKSGKQAEARALLEALLKLSTQRFVPPYHIALIHNGLGERDETLAWLERGYKERDPKMVFLKVEPKWNNLRTEPRFQDLMRRVGFNL